MKAINVLKTILVSSAVICGMSYVVDHHDTMFNVDTYVLNASANGKDPSTTPDYNNEKGWPNWSQLAGAELKKWGPGNGACVIVTRMRVGASHGGKGVPTDHPMGAPYAVAGNYKTVNYSGYKQEVSGGNLQEQIKNVIPKIKEIQNKGDEVELRVTESGGNAFGGQHSMMVDNIEGNDIYVFDPAVGGPQWKAWGAAGTGSIVMAVDVHPEKGGKRLDYGSSATRAKVGGDGTIVSKGGGGGKSDDSADNKDNQSGDDEVTVHPIFNPFQAPTRATDMTNTNLEDSSNTGATGEVLSTQRPDAYNNLQRMNAASGFLSDAYQWTGTLAIVLIFVLGGYMLVGMLMYVLDEVVFGARISSAANNLGGIGGKIIMPDGKFFGINPVNSRGITMSLGETMLRQMVVVLLLAMAGSGFATYMFGEIFKLFTWMFNGGAG